MLIKTIPSHAIFKKISMYKYVQTNFFNKRLHSVIESNIFALFKI